MWIILDFKCLYFLEKRSMIFQKSLTKYLINKIKEPKNFQNFLITTYRRNWKENLKNNKKMKISHNYIFVKELLEFADTISNPSNKTLQKIP